MQISFLKYKFVTLKVYWHGKPCPANTNVSFIWFVGYANCCQAFLFSLVNPSALGAIKLSLIPGREGHGIYSNSSCGPVFGSGCDLYITNNANTSSCTSCLGTTYQYPPGKQSSFLTGDHDFFVIDYEVFALQQWQNTSRKGSCG